MQQKKIQGLKPKKQTYGNENDIEAFLKTWRCDVSIVYKVPSTTLECN
jgi:hypothetical protein